MQKQFSDKSEAIILQKAAESLESKRSVRCKRWMTRRSPGFRFVLVTAWIATAYNLIVFLATTIGLWLQCADDPAYTSDARTATICVALIAVSALLLAFKKHFAASAASVLFAVFYLINSRALWMNRVFYNSRQVESVYIFIPFTLIALVCAIYVITVCSAEKLTLRAEYRRIVDKITNTYAARGEVTTAEQWDEYVRLYTEPDTGRKEKRSVRDKARKARKEKK